MLDLECNVKTCYECPLLSSMHAIFAVRMACCVQSNLRKSIKHAPIDQLGAVKHTPCNQQGLSTQFAFTDDRLYVKVYDITRTTLLVKRKTEVTSLRYKSRRSS